MFSASCVCKPKASVRALVLGFIFTCVSLAFLHEKLALPVRRIFRHSSVSTPCVIPQLDPFHPSIMKFMKDLPPLKCDGRHDVVYADFNGTLQYNDSALADLHLTRADVSCTFWSVRRDTDDVHIYLENETTIQAPQRVTTDVVRVACKDRFNKTMMDKFLSTIARNHHGNATVLKESPAQLSVLLFAVDSASRSAGIRKLPKTVQYLKDDLGSYDMTGFMKIGENTLPNIMALLTGLKTYTSEVPHNDYIHKVVDDFPFIWKDFQDKGFATFYGEDYPILSTFNCGKRGFYNQPTMHYARPLYLALGRPESDRPHCYGNKARHNVAIYYLQQFLTAYRGDRKFSFLFLNELSHDKQNLLTYGDEDFVQFLKWLKVGGHLENTVLIFFSDHGTRMELEIRNTFVGKIEDRMPMMHIVLPDSLKSRYAHIDKAMQTNINRLATFYDLHQMLSDVLNESYDSPSTTSVREKVRGISLFQELPVKRSCADAWISENFCACYTSEPINISTNIHGEILKTNMIADLNRRFADIPECAELSFYDVIDFRKVSDALEHTGDAATGISIFQFFKPEVDESQRYDISIETVPGHGTFEASYVVDAGNNVKRLGEIVRTNKYGNQSHCVLDSLIKPFCYCKDNLME